MKNLDKGGFGFKINFYKVINKRIKIVYNVITNTNILNIIILFITKAGDNMTKFYRIGSTIENDNNIYRNGDVAVMQATRVVGHLDET